MIRCGTRRTNQFRPRSVVEENWVTVDRTWRYLAGRASHGSPGDTLAQLAGTTRSACLSAHDQTFRTT